MTPVDPARFGCITLLGAGLTMWIPIIGWIAAPVLFVIGVASLIPILFRPKTRTDYDCQRCKHRFSIEESSA